MSEVAYDENIASLYLKYRDQDLVGKHIEIPHLKQGLGSVTDKTIVDIGCGTGFHMVLFSDQNPKKQIGVDISVEQLSRARQLLEDSKITNFELIENNLGKNEEILEKIPENSVDIVFSSYVICHMDNEEMINNYLRVQYKMLKKGGKFVIYGNNPKNTRQLDKKIQDIIGESEIALLDSKTGWVDGAGYHICLRTGENTSCPLDDTYWTKETISKKLTEIGFSNVEIIGMTQKEEALNCFTEEQWEELSKGEVRHVITAIK